jgi:hypothetical protein
LIFAMIFGKRRHELGGRMAEAVLQPPALVRRQDRRPDVLAGHPPVEERTGAGGPEIRGMNGEGDVILVGAGDHRVDHLRVGGLDVDLPHPVVLAAALADPPVDEAGEGGGEGHRKGC